jgi:inner membrane protease subunit 1
MSTTSYGCKRIIGMPGDLVCAVSPGKQEKDLHTVDGDFGTFKDEMFRVPEGHCWLAGDNLEWSRDSRLIGPVPLALVKGKVMAVLFPFSAWKWLGNGGLEDLKEGEPEWVAG